MRALLLCGLAFCLAVAACAEREYSLDDQAKDDLTRIHTYKRYFVDEYGRYVHLHGANVSGSSKIPSSLDPVSYVGKPFPLEEADGNFRVLQNMGFNTIRLILIWEAVEPDAPGEYDEEYLDYIAEIVRLAGDYGIYVQLDMHQDGFSRWLRRYYDDEQDVNALESIPGLDYDVPAMFNNSVQGDGAPRWAVQLCLPEKNVGGPLWGYPFWMVDDRRETTDMTAFHWGFSLFASVDIARTFATFFGGRDVYPNYLVDGKNVADYLQDAYAAMWVQVAKRVKDLPNVLGYDIMNEPIGIFYIFDLYALLHQEAETASNHTLSDAQVEAQVDALLKQFRRDGMSLEEVEIFRRIWLEEVRLPRTPEEFEEAGFPLNADDGGPYQPDWDGVLALNANFNRTYLQPFFSRVGQAIQNEDPNAVIFIEPSLGFDEDSGILGLGRYVTPMLAPEGVKQLVYAPHFYTDVYPFIIGVNPEPRDFTVDEIKFRDYTAGILAAIDNAAFSLGNPPVVLGEFGTYFNLGGIDKAMATDFAVPANILDNYYDVLEENLIHRQVWCYSPENTTWWGEGWNREDFSVLGADQQPRADDAYSRVAPRFTSGRLVAYKYNSPLAYYEPKPGVPTPFQEFNLEMEGLESSAPTEIFVPRSKFQEGFYVYVSDGRCKYDPTRQIVYWYVFEDNPDVHHTIRIRPPYDDYGDQSWSYFFNGDVVMEGRQ